MKGGNSKSVAALLLALGLAGCGGGSDTPGAQQLPPNTLLVVAGDSSLVPQYVDAGGSGGDSASGDSGPGLGRFRNALVRVELADGRSAGEAEVDPVRGVVHVRLANYGGPVRFTARGKADGSTTYFDEAAGRFVPYPAGAEINAVVARFDRNVGITILTESAWRYLATRYGPNAWKDAARVVEANNTVRDNFNPFVAPEFRVSDITRLPFLLSDNTAAGSIPATENGRYGVVLSGLGIAAGLFRPNDPAPVLAVATQMPLDYCDGVLDGACNGVPVADPAQAAYTVAQLPQHLATGVDEIVRRFMIVPPSITAQPQDAASLAGQTVTFSVAATGTAPLAYQWRRNGAPIAGATGTALTLTTALADNGATFAVAVSNNAGSVVSRSARLTVTASQVAPAITRQPRSLTVAEGLDASFAVDATGTGPLSYQWSRNGVPIAGATGARYATPVAALGDSGATFTVNIANLAGSVVSDAAILTVHTQGPICANAAGGGWCWRNPSPQGNSLYGVAYVNASTAVAVGDFGSILRTTDGGATWTAVWQQGNGLQDVAFANDTLGIAVGVQGTILRTTDGGTNWNAVASGTMNALRRVRFVTAGVVVAVGQNNTILRSVDGGSTWTSVATAGPIGLFGLGFADAAIGLATGDNGTILRTTDGGLTWNGVPSGTTGGLSRVEFADRNTAVALGGAGVILRSIDAGTSWNLVALPTTRATADVAFADAATGVAVGRATVRTVDGGATWSEVQTGGVNLTAVRFANDSDGLAVGVHGELLRTVDAGATWSVLSRGPATNLLDVAFADAARGIAVGDAARILRTTDGGVTWNPVASGRSGPLYGAGFAGSVGVVVGNTGTLIRSNDGGVTWVPVVVPTTNHLYDAAFADAATVVAVGDGGTILRSLDAGATWSQVPNTIGRQLMRVVFLGAALGIAVGTDGTVLRSSDAGATWSAATTGTTAHLFGVAFAGNSSTVIAVGSGGLTLRSTNGGLNWNTIATGVPAGLLGVHFADAANGMLVGQSGWALRTTDGGLSWSPLTTSMGGDLNVVRMFDATTAVAAGQFGAIVRTTTGGQ